ncbi:MAG: class I SAM-dependent methyltransferase [Chloroflexi bacterium]|nr:class I SAM-dependent methyltransferase [Chloroflexota bacterium]
MSITWKSIYNDILLPYMNSLLFSFTLKHHEKLKTDFVSKMTVIIFNIFAHGYDRAIEKIGLEHFYKPLAHISDSVEPPGKILDLCCGTGVSAEYLAGQFPESRITAVDISPGMLEKARARCSAFDNITFCEADARRLPFPDGYFDMVISLNAPPFVEEMLRVAAPHSSIFIVWTLAGRFASNEQVIKNFLSKWGPVNFQVEKIGRALVLKIMKQEYTDESC